MTALVTNVPVFPTLVKLILRIPFQKIDFLLLTKIFMSVKLVVLTFIIQYAAS